ncbi:MAG: DUF1326 domain-containing protein [Actinobacteria bacterium]|nr:DUF1326 domain-containing protein [Actinomycetota bacterium]
MTGNGKVPPWHIKGTLLGACNCDWGCPCNFQAPPTYGFCDGFYAIVVEDGRYGDLSLDGVRFLMGGHTPGAIHHGEGTSILVLDQGMSPGQRTAIETLWRGGGVGSPFDEFASVTTVWFEPIVAPIEVRLEGIRSSVKVAGGDIYDLEIARVRNPVTGAEEITHFDHPTGFSSKYAELGMSTVARFSSKDASFDTSGKYAEYAEISYSGP